MGGLKLAVEMLPANHGDSLLVEWGDGASVHRMLVDGGPGYARPAVASALPLPCHLDLLVVTHVDYDHLAGILALLGDPPPGLTIGEVWFNARHHLGPATRDEAARGGVQGDALTALLEAGGSPWNARFGGGPVALAQDGSAPVVTLDGGLRLTVLGPTLEALARLRPQWEAEIDAAGADERTREAVDALQRERGLAEPAARPGPPPRPDPRRLAAERFEPDDSRANGSSIALLAEAGGRRLLLAGDAFPSQVLALTSRLAADEHRRRLRVDAVKLSHHGSHGNTNPALIQALRSPRWMFSSNGKIFGHPAPQCVARVVTRAFGRPELLFNYRTEENAIWDDAALRERFGYSTTYGDRGRLRVELA